MVTSVSAARLLLYSYVQRNIRNHVDKYVITKHYYQLMLLSLATSGFRRKGNITNLKRKGTSMKINSPRRRLRLCPRANKNLHIPAGYAESAMPRAFP
ncbi:hypothetical protein T07_8617 [Trichinella nelsoni]|uniref:Uncharacterized protein n=1 Tax=Trichinella nelsoni TaxID=6336 RepID=A0A0V0RF22_9BILA|nr:hypothetical protein T07_8617 [Trichinella nelsoni]